MLIFDFNNREFLNHFRIRLVDYTISFSLLLRDPPDHLENIVTGVKTCLIILHEIAG
jgi:hypothetical protein